MSCHDIRPMSPSSAMQAPDSPSTTAQVHDARTLTGGAQTARIVLDGQCYILRITRAGKLILTK